MNKNFFVTATSTGIGKTIISAAICRILSDKFGKVAYYKPLQTGAKIILNKTLKSPDCSFVAKINSDKENIFTYSTYLFKKSASPHLAARVENKEIQINTIVDEYKTIIKQNDAIIVEGAGGLLVPLNEENVFISHLAKLLKLKTILVVSAGLGAINETCLNIFYLKKSKINITAIFLLTKNEPPDEIEKDNHKTIKNITEIKNIFLIPKFKNIDTQNYKPGDFYDKIKYFPGADEISRWLNE